MADAAGAVAIFAIVIRDGHTLKPLGTGFYLQPHGGFATAAHVALEPIQKLVESDESVVIP
jgi:hypothetical protein